MLHTQTLSLIFKPPFFCLHFLSHSFSFSIHLLTTSFYILSALLLPLFNIYHAICWCFLLCPPCFWLCMASSRLLHLSPTNSHMLVFFSFSFPVCFINYTSPFPLCIVFLLLFLLPSHPCWPSFVFLLFSVDPVPLPLRLPFFSGLGWMCCVFGCQVSMGWKSLTWIKCSACPPPPLSGVMRALCPSGRSSAAWRWVRTYGLFQPQVCVNVFNTQEDYHNAVALNQGPGVH